MATATTRGALHLTREQVRQVDRRAVEDYHMPSVILMENAARALCDQALAMLSEQADATSVAILCGGGNNGGDGLALARHLHNAGVPVTVLLFKDDSDYQHDAATNLAICRAMKLRMVTVADEPVETLTNLEPQSLLVDALLGTGIDSPVRSPFDRIIRWLNAQRTPVLAVDVPSGLDCDTGQPLGIGVQADATVTFVASKVGFGKPDAQQFTGQVYVGDIGVPRQLIEQVAGQS